nr:sarcosine oxidase subunit gamma family protein [Rhizobium sp. CG5]
MCKMTRCSAVAMVEVTGIAGAWPAELSAVVVEMGAGGFVLNLSPERRIVRLGGVVAKWHQAVADARGRLVDVTHAWQRVVIEGRWARDLLARAIDLDLQSRHFRAGQVVSTLCGRVPVILHATGEESFDLFVATSYTNWLFKWLEVVRAPLVGDGDETTAAHEEI